MTASGRKICVSGLLQFPCCVVFHCLGFAVFGAIGFPVDDSAFESFHCVTEPDKKENGSTKTNVKLIGWYMQIHPDV